MSALSSFATDEQTAEVVGRLDEVEDYRQDPGEVVGILATLLPSEVNEAILRAMKRGQS